MNGTRQDAIPVPPERMRSAANLLRHGAYLALYSLVKHFSFPMMNLARWAVLRLFGARIRSTYIADGVLIWFPWNVRIGRRSSLNQGVIIDGFGGVTIGDGVRIAAYAVINTADHAFDDPGRMICDQGFLVAPVVIEDDVWIGTGAVVGKGVRIGRGSVIGAGAVVTRDIPPGSVAVGVPCRVIRRRGPGPRPSPEAGRPA